MKGAAGQGSSHKFFMPQQVIRIRAFRLRLGLFQVWYHVLIFLQRYYITWSQTPKKHKGDRKPYELGCEK
ncbi:hypothetical protein CN958_24790 [Bacillus cereus]|uniref:Uncharacterized protein n=1 Tax=Bacillus cereus TaxID=1396 RepID=A0A2B9DL60_BACCE|nr:hypothetical protein CN958_24790 [Bacillus cereus]